MTGKQDSDAVFRLDVDCFCTMMGVSLAFLFTWLHISAAFLVVNMVCMNLCMNHATQASVTPRASQPGCVGPPGSWFLYKLHAVFLSDIGYALSRCMYK